MSIPIKWIFKEIIQQYNLQKLVHNCFVYIDVQKAMYGLPQAGQVAYKNLKKHLNSNGYHKIQRTEGYWRHETKNISFPLIVDDFGIKCIRKENGEHLLNTLKKNYEVEVDWTGSLYCGIELNWNYERGWPNTKMGTYVRKALKRFNHEKPRKP